MTYLEFKKRVLMHYVTKYRLLEAIPEPVYMALWMKFKAVDVETLPQSISIVFAAGVTLKKAVDVLALAFGFDINGSVAGATKAVDVETLPTACDESIAADVYAKVIAPYALPYKAENVKATGKVEAEARLIAPAVNKGKVQFALSDITITAHEIDKCVNSVYVSASGTLTAVASNLSIAELPATDFKNAALTTAVAIACLKAEYAKIEGAAATDLTIKTDFLGYYEYGADFNLSIATASKVLVQNEELAVTKADSALSPTPEINVTDSNTEEQVLAASFGGTFAIAANMEEFAECSLSDVVAACNLSVAADMLILDDYVIDAQLPVSVEASIAHDYITHDEAEGAVGGATDITATTSVIGIQTIATENKASLGCSVSVDMVRKAAVVDYTGYSVESLKGISAEDTAYIE